jgi:heme O synthase-like polyprenyltransferase
MHILFSFEMYSSKRIFCFLLTCKKLARFVQANGLADRLAASNLVLYAFMYTPLKQIHPVNIWVGAIVGVIPPLLG